MARERIRLIMSMLTLIGAAGTECVNNERDVNSCQLNDPILTCTTSRDEWEAGNRIVFSSEEEPRVEGRELSHLEDAGSACAEGGSPCRSGDRCVWQTDYDPQCLVDRADSELFFPKFTLLT